MALQYLHECRVSKNPLVSLPCAWLGSSSGEPQVPTERNKSQQQQITHFKMEQSEYDMSLSSGAPRWVSELNFVQTCPPGIDGLLSDKSMTPLSRRLMGFIHVALVGLALLIVVVRNKTSIGLAAVVFIDHPINIDAIAQV